MSAALANLYMLEADRTLFELLGEQGASYRRYSDDILIITRPGDGEQAERVVRESLKAMLLLINDRKTQAIAFRRDEKGIPGGFVIERCEASDGTYSYSQPSKQRRALVYLGLEWDGTQARLRDATVARFLAKMKRAVQAAMYAAERNNDLKLRRRKLYRRFSKLGYRERIFKVRSRLSAKGREDRFDRGTTFLDYGSGAHAKTGSEVLRRQVGGLWIKLQRDIRQAEWQLKTGRVRLPHAPDE